MGSTPSKPISNSPSFKHMLKYFLTGNLSNGVRRTYPKHSSINNMNNNKYTENQTPIQMSSKENNAKSFENERYDYHTPQQEIDLLDVSLHKRLQNLGPVQRQDELTNNTFTIPSLSRNDDLLRTAKLPSSVPSQVVLNPSVSRLKSAKPSSPSPLSSVKKQIPDSATSPVLDSIRKTGLLDDSTAKTNNSAVALLMARNLFAKEAEVEFSKLGKSGYKGRRFLDLDTVGQILVMRDANEGLGDEEIERRLGLGNGIVKLLGKKGIIGVVG